ncbi:MAG: YraN family protein [Lewinella sp.]|nr:YraN family protein [Lewinella sp.]
MAKHLDLGSRGEQLAKELLEAKGYVLLETNWRYRRSEVDLIVKDGVILVFVEVKTRTTAYFGSPETFVTPQKEKLLVRAAHAYMQQSEHEWEIRFDVVSIVWESEEKYTAAHLEDAFWPGSW